MKNTHNNKNRGIKPLFIKRSPKLLSLAVTSCLASMVAVSAQATDLEIYQAAEAGKPTVVLMLDVSGSMGGSRIANLRQGVIDLVSDPDMLNGINIGIGTYPNNNGWGGQIDIPAKLLDETHKQDIIRAARLLRAGGGTPAAQAYAEAAAYMMGTTTYNNSQGRYLSGIGSNSSNRNTWGNNGFYYNSPLPAEESCAGQAIYFLTDGSPNSSSDARASAVMNDALTPVGSNTPTSTVSCNGGGLSGYIGTQWSGWPCMLDFVDHLLDKDQNPSGVKIKTATVGFGSGYSSLQSAKTLTDCDTASGDVRLLCTLGIKGEGGFYYAANSTDIVKSVQSLVDILNEDITPVSTGTISVPLDSLGSFTSRKFAYLPILNPVPGQASLWDGNLKKYNVKDATLRGGNNNFVFKDTLGQFANDTYDLWNSTGTVDKAKPQVGGAYQQIFENTGSTRNLFVSNSGELAKLSVNSSKKPVVLNSDGTEKTSGFDSLSGYDNNQKLALVHFMGYAEPDSTTITRYTRLRSSFDPSIKNVGGVLHSVPQLITTEVKLKDNGQFDANTRKDYLLYGSMDGALHMLDDKSGQEMFTFIPKQILELQADAIKEKGTTKNGTYPYGVDGPWQTYASYKVNPSSKTYKASQVFAMGGLRMGGSTYYALDVSDISNPKIIYSVGSNYSNRLQGSTDVLQGMKNDVMSTSGSEQQAFSRMGQTWAKPATGYVRSGGKRVMVNFLPGGYDTCYEYPQFKLNTTYAAGVTIDAYTDADKVRCSNKSSAQGNAMYMVQVGEKEKGKEKVKIDQDNGKLLWWASNIGTGNDKTTRSNSLQYSKHPDLKHSVVTQVRALDRNYDGLTDHIYFADLGGQVWRVDINNNEDTDNFKIDRVVKVLDVGDQVDGKDAPPRFYERPLITFYNSDYGFEDTNGNKGTYNGVMTLVTVGTGDRSSPVESARIKPDALYSFIDKDVTRKDLFEYDDSKKQKIYMRTSNVQTNNLAKLTFTNADIGKSGIPAKMRSNKAQGWYLPFTHWLGKDNVVIGGKYKLKMFNEPDALASVLIFSTYDPDKGNTAGRCSAGVKGQTQRERTCLPYGVCLDDNGKSIKTERSQKAAGVGIADNFITQFNDSAIFTSIRNKCEGDECKPEVICSDDSCEVDGLQSCTGPGCDTDSGVNTDQRINPLSWMEHAL